MPVCYESDSSIGHVRFLPAVTVLGLSGYEAFRADTHQQLLVPRTYFG